MSSYRRYQCVCALTAAVQAFLAMQCARVHLPWETGLFGVAALAMAGWSIRFGEKAKAEERAARTAAVRAERAARPHRAPVDTAAQDAAAITLDRINDEKRMAAFYDDADLCTSEFPGDDLDAGQLCIEPAGHDGDHKALAELGPGWRRHITWPNAKQESAR